MVRFLMYRAVWAVGLVLAFAQPAWAGGFHPPASDAEKTLARIIALSQDDKQLPHYLLMHSSADPAREKQDNDNFTPALLRALQDEEADSVHTHCGGRYIQGEKCGISYNPITCLDYERPAYFYRTDSAGAYTKGEYNTVIAYRLPEGRQIIATYNMLKVDSKWKMDGIDCAIGGSFNM